MKLLRILIINITLLLIIFIFLEGLCRFVGIPYKVKWVPSEQAFVRFDSELGWLYTTNKSVKHKTAGIEVPIHFDENGIRVPNDRFKFDFTHPSVLFIGGSVTMGHGLLFEESFPGKFQELSKDVFQVVNLGVQAYGTDQALLTLKKFLPQFNTKIVVYDFAEEFISRNGSYDRRQLIPNAKFLGTKPLFALDKDGKLYLAKKPKLYKDYINSYLFDFLKMKIGSITGSFPPFPEKLTKELILEMKRYSERHGAHFVVLNWRWTKDDYNRLFEDLDVNVIDTMEDAPEGWQDMVLFEGSHPNAQASEHVAGLLLKYFIANGLLDSNGNNH